MSFTLQFLRGTTAENDAYTGKDGEVTIDTEKGQLRIHDGVTAGGKVAAGGSDPTSGLGGESLTGEDYEALLYYSI